MKKEEKNKATEELKKKPKTTKPVAPPDQTQKEDEAKVGLPDIDLKKFMGCGG
ncbi:hypothetical protein N6H18_01535 [Reichenbachiella agarivorans]|uniref:Uncharacterized protein n=1 Tax=Reichenbachiella agarivorans TaxID=2979464 RepID=A0ABY6CRJ0_9BACT|nr:hypothetical protein [Reichenbachiella agarivorans]UXP32650.1 hypothetical protein N6H18_01535 [Reichenbachiella agarivorans]